MGKDTSGFLAVSDTFTLCIDSMYYEIRCFGPWAWQLFDKATLLALLSFAANGKKLGIVD